VVHEALHTCGGICWTEGHHPWGIEPSGCFKSHKVLCFITVSTVLNVPIPITEVKFTEEYHSSHSFDDGDNVREGKDIFDCDSIDLLVIEYRAVTPVPFFDIEDGCQIWGFRFSDKTSIFLFLNVLCLKFFFSTGQRIDLAGDRRRGVRNEGYSMVLWSVWQ